MKINVGDDFYYIENEYSLMKKMAHSYTIFIPPANSQTISGLPQKITSAKKQKIALKIKCPICSRTYCIKVPKLALDESMDKGGMTSISIEPSCNHRFVIYVDTNYKIRGYGKINFCVKTDEECSTEKIIE